MRRCLTICLSLWLITAVNLLAQEEVNVFAQVNKQVISEEEILQLSISISAERTLQEIDVKFPSLSDFEKLGEQTRQNYSQINNKIEMTFSYVYSLYPKRKGKLRIPAIEVVVNGKSYTTEPIEVTVNEGQQSSEIIARVNPDKRSAYVGQQIVVNTELLFRTSVTSYDIVEQPTPEGFIVLLDESIHPNPPIDVVRVNGLDYQRAVLRRQILFPLSPGEKILEPLVFRIHYRSSGFDFGTKIARRATERIRINVKPLPDGQPEGFLGAVGEFSVDWSIDRTEGKSNEPFTLSINLAGYGDVERAPDIKPELPEGFEIINSSTTSNSRFNDGSWGGTKSWEYILIPNRPGEKTIPPLIYSYFDPESQSYKTTNTDFIALNIAEADKQAPIVLPAQILPDSTEEDIRHIKTVSKSLANQHYHFVGSAVFWAIVFIPPFLNILLIAGRRIIGLSKNGNKGVRRRKALSKSLSQLKTVSGSPKYRDQDLSTIRNAVIGYFAAKLEKSVDTLSFSEIRSELVRFDVHESEDINTLSQILDLCDADRFSPDLSESDSTADMSSRAQEALERLDKQI